MVLQMFAQQMPQYRIGTESGGSKEFIAPWPDQPRRSKASLLDQRAYASSQWRGDDMCLLEFLRKSGDDGQGSIVQWLTRKHKQHVWSTAYAAYLLGQRRRHWAQTTFRLNIGKGLRAYNSERAAAGAAAVDLVPYIKSRTDLVGSGLALVDLETYAREYEMQGEKAIACVMLSRFSDEYYGQWLVLNVPWRDLG
eukprot:7821311-Karenia_brevis.AAC.1